jgi:small ligand-binding sensory domain FIST
MPPATTIVSAMTVCIGSGISQHPDARMGAVEAAVAARAGLDGRRADVAVVFAAGAHLAAPEATLEGVHEALAPRQLVGCGAGGVLAAGREVEDGTSVAVWAAALGPGTAEAFHAVADDAEEGPQVTGLPDIGGASGAVLLGDPFTFPADQVVASVSAAAPGVPVVGGIASARTADGAAALFLGAEVVDRGAVGLRFEGVEVLPCVSQGAAPVGPELTITAAAGHVIHELAGRPALEKLRDVIEGLGTHERVLLSQGVLLGVVVDPNKPEYEQGDFLVRGLLGADVDTGAIAVAADVHAGQVVRLQVRDAASADRDLRAGLALRRQALGDRAPAGALVFTCNGRGRGMFGVPDHDAAVVDTELGGIPAAGFFAAGEIGPVGSGIFLHGFTATVAVFAP